MKRTFTRSGGEIGRRAKRKKDPSRNQRDGKIMEEQNNMAYCVNCGADLGDKANFCSSCGTAVNGNTQTQNDQDRASGTAKTAATIAGTAIGVSVLNRILHRRRHRMMPPPPHRGPMGGPRGPRGGPGGRGPGGRGPHGGGFGRP